MIIFLVRFFVLLCHKDEGYPGSANLVFVVLGVPSLVKCTSLAFTKNSVLFV